MSATREELFHAIKAAPFRSAEYDAAIQRYDEYMLAHIGDWEFLTFPVAWAIQRTYGNGLEHHERCSSVEGWDRISGPGFLCDCSAVRSKWEQLRITAHDQH